VGSLLPGRASRRAAGPGLPREPRSPRDLAKYEATVGCEHEHAGHDLDQNELSGIEPQPVRSDAPEIVLTTVRMDENRTDLLQRLLPTSKTRPRRRSAGRYFGRVT
jgi:hypothetical protein